MCIYCDKTDFNETRDMSSLVPNFDSSIAVISYLENSNIWTLSVWVMNKTTDERHCVTTPITHCPWCGEKLPLNLDSWAWIEYEYGEEYAR